VPPALITGAADASVFINVRLDSQQPQKQRLHFIDWLRALVIGLVVAFHTIDLFADYTYSAGVYLGIVNTPPSDASRQVAIVCAQLIQVGGSGQGLRGWQRPSQPVPLRV
jgi:hypothetical protein